MPTITSTGVGSGLDVENIVSSLMALERRPLQQLQLRESTMQTRISAFGSLKSQFSSLADAAGKLADVTKWNPLKVDSNGAEFASASADSKAAPGKHTLEVERLAQGQTLASAPYASGATVVGTGKLTLQLGRFEGGVFTDKAESKPVEIVIDSAHQTLAGVRDAINAAKSGVTASIVTGGGGAQLVLRSADGAENSVRILATDDDNNATDAAGLSALAYDPAAAAGAGRNLLQTQAAQDARFTLDGIALTSASNSPTTVLEGVTLSLKKVTTAPVEINVSTDSAALRKNVNDFISAYNSLAKLLKTQTAADPGGTGKGPLQADSTAVSLQRALADMLRGTVTGAEPPHDSLNAIGVEIGRDGTLQLDDKRFTKALEDPTRLGRLFHQEQAGEDPNSRGFAVRFQAWARTLAQEDGLIDSRIDGLQASAKSNQKQQEAQSDRIARAEARLRAQYSRLDTQMSSLNGEMSRMLSALGLG